MKTSSLKIEWRSNEGYGDFISGLCYAHSSTIKYDRPIEITFHWPNRQDYLMHPDDEPIYYRFERILDRLRPAERLTIKHKFESFPEYRAINSLEATNHSHGLWYHKNSLKAEHGLVALWTSRHNVTFPGYHKDPAYDYWDDIIEHIEDNGYKVAEITYRTPIDEALDIMERCEFGIGYQGMVHELFKFLWKPCIIFSKQYELSKLLLPMSHIIEDPNEFLLMPIDFTLNKSKLEVEKYKRIHNTYMQDKVNPEGHPNYDRPTR